MPDTFGIFIFRDVCEKPFEKKKGKKREKKGKQRGNLKIKGHLGEREREHKEEHTSTQLDGIGRALTVIRTKARKGRWSAKKQGDRNAKRLVHAGNRDTRRKTFCRKMGHRRTLFSSVYREYRLIVSDGGGIFFVSRCVQRSRERRGHVVYPARISLIETHR